MDDSREEWDVLHVVEPHLHGSPGELMPLDEAAMVDVVLGHQLLRGVSSETCLILVGNVGQLATIGLGSVMADLRSPMAQVVITLVDVNGGISKQMGPVI